MRKTLFALGLTAALALVVFMIVSFMSDQVIVDNLTGDALIAAIQTKINYNSIAFISLIIGGIAFLGLAFITFSNYIAKWQWVSRLP